DNTAPGLDDGEHRELRRLKEILPASRVIRNMSEKWLIEAGLSPMPREMMVLRDLRGGKTSTTPSTCSPGLARERPQWTLRLVALGRRRRPPRQKPLGVQQPS
ncbi:unnamed protein product, partial [Musa acuminata subsp. burmannicoides]